MLWESVALDSFLQSNCNSVHHCSKWVAMGLVVGFSDHPAPPPLPVSKSLGLLMVARMVNVKSAISYTWLMWIGGSVEAISLISLKRENECSKWRHLDGWSCYGYCCKLCWLGILCEAGVQAAGGYLRLLKKCELSHDQLAWSLERHYRMITQEISLAVKHQLPWSPVAWMDLWQQLELFVSHVSCSTSLFLMYPMQLLNC